MAAYALPNLPYDYGARQLAMTGEVLELRRADYVKGANDTLEQLTEAAEPTSPVTKAGPAGRTAS